MVMSFWEVLKELTEQEKRSFLKFVTRYTLSN